MSYGSGDGGMTVTIGFSLRSGASYNTEGTAGNMSIVTLKQIICSCMHNDLGFMVNYRLIVPVEAQLCCPTPADISRYLQNACTSSNKQNKFGTKNESCQFRIA
ncbi:MAG: hypothetical protein IJ242_10935 [Clostridia bacterium]|nr:hypothetical protein [Clostridia bacterium]